MQDGLVKPLAESESKGSRFSRARPLPRERRVRVTQASATTDKRGKKFVAFAVDVRFGGGQWQANDIVGCAYAGSGELFVKSGPEFFPAALLLGKKVDPVAGACAAAPPPPSA